MQTEIVGVSLDDRTKLLNLWRLLAANDVLERKKLLKDDFMGTRREI